jgi:hypothetical protein
VPLIFIFLHAAANQPTISGATLCHKKLGRPCYTPEEQFFLMSKIILSYPEEF